MHETPTDHAAHTPAEGARAPQPHREQHGPGLLSQSDPEPERSTGRAPIWLIIVIIALVTGLVALHLTGVVGPGAH